MKTKRIFLWVSAALLTLLAIYPVIAKYKHWSFSSPGFIIWPLTIGLLLIVINRLRNFDYSSSENVATNCSLKVDYRVRYSLINSMKMKRRAAWLPMAAAAIIAIVVAVGFIMEGSLFWLLPLVLSGVLGWIGFNSKRYANAIEKSLKTNDQTAFNEAVSRWSKRYRITVLGYVLIAVIPVLTIVLVTIGQSE